MHVSVCRMWRGRMCARSRSLPLAKLRLPLSRRLEDIVPSLIYLSLSFTGVATPLAPLPCSTSPDLLVPLKRVVPTPRQVSPNPETERERERLRLRRRSAEMRWEVMISLSLSHTHTRKKGSSNKVSPLLSFLKTTLHKRKKEGQSDRDRRLP